jgi:phosphopantothenoylcysteine decarboxylase/phosphopantothenate--cysteine ligase
MFETVTGNPAHSDLFADPFSHINLTKESHLFIIAPATANTINKFSCGIADNLLTNLWLTHDGPVLMAPAMNFRMYRNPLVKKHVRELGKLGVLFAGPVSGSLACGEEGVGRMVEVPEIVEAAVSALMPKDLKGHNILVTAGPTREPIDPVRFISNRSSGKMGYAIARAALRRGADVSLISGPSSLKAPEGAFFTSVEGAAEMEAAVFKQLKKSTAVIMTAAVSDYSPLEAAQVKLKKKDSMLLNLKKNNDILRAIGESKGKRTLVGFAAESGNDVKSAKTKLKGKNLDLIVLNDISKEGSGFDVDTNVVTLIDKKGRIDEYPMMKKIGVADVILDRILGMKKEKS